MNIFFLHEQPHVCAEYHCDKHVVKMILESAQLLSTAHRVLDNSTDDRLYKATHVNHPSAIWARETDGNYNWLFSLFFNLCKEYTFRYNKNHKCESMCSFLLYHPENITIAPMTTPPICMPEQYKVDLNPVKCYRAYYNGDKARFAKWKLGNVPDWFIGGINNV